MLLWSGKRKIKSLLDYEEETEMKMDRPEREGEVKWRNAFFSPAGASMLGTLGVGVFMQPFLFLLLGFVL